MSKENPTFTEATLKVGVGVARIAFYFGATIGGAALIGTGAGVAVPVFIGGVWVAKKLGYFKK